jgi:stage III sporulation protein AB
MIHIFIKIMGAVFVLAGGCGTGWYFSAKKKRRIQVLQEFEQVLILLYGEIEYAGEDMVETLEGLVPKTVWFSSFFQEVAFYLRRKCGHTLWKTWERGIENSPLTEVLEPEDCSLWKEVGSHLGILGRQSQLRSIELSQKRLGRQLAKAQEEYSSQAKLFHVLGVTAGVFVVILLL